MRDLFIFRSLASLFNPFARKRLGCDAELVVDEVRLGSVRQLREVGSVTGLFLPSSLVRSFWRSWTTRKRLATSRQVRLVF